MGAGTIRFHRHNTNQIFDADTGDPASFGSTVAGISDVPGLQTALDGKQPLDSDLTAIAALTTTSFGRSLLAVADAAAGRTALEVTAGATAEVNAAGRIYAYSNFR